jgi:hypothetical protein
VYGPVAALGVYVNVIIDPEFAVVGDIILERYKLLLLSNQFTIPVKLGGTRVVVVFANTSVSTVEDVTVQLPIKGEKLVVIS